MSLFKTSICGTLRLLGGGSSILAKITFKVLATLVICLGVSSSVHAFTLFPNDSDGYVPKPSDIYVPADAGVCCMGEYNSITNVYWAQTFKATIANPTSLTLGLGNNLPADVPPAPFNFRLLITEVLPGFHPGSILWESGDLSISASIPDYHELTFAITEVNFTIGTSYAWILDTYSTRDGVQDGGAFFGNIGLNVAPYTDGVLYVAKATGAGRAADFSSTWTDTGIDAAFLMTIPEPASIVLLSIGLAVLGFSRRKQA